MTQLERIAPGPAGTSCLTCKRRHKKCDLRRPVCARCEKGGFECLGYSHNKQSGSRPRSSIPRPIPSNQDIANNATSQTTSSSMRLELSILDYNSGTTLLLQGDEQNAGSLASSSLDLGDQPINSTQHLGHAGTYPESETPMTQNPQPSLNAQPLAKRTLSPTPSLKSLLAFYTRIPYVPYHMSKMLLDNANLEDYLMDHWDRMMGRMYFKPLQVQAPVRNLQIVRVRASSFTRWVLFLSAKILESYPKRDTSQNQTYDLSIRQMEQVLNDVLARNLSPRERQERLGNWMKVTLLKLTFFHSSNGYQVIRSATPAFLQMLFSEPTLWPSDGGITVPLVNVITSSRHEFGYFALLDITTAMAFGLPQQVEYDTSLPCPPNGSAFHEWLYSSPIEFLITLAEINACRDKRPNARDWREIEHRLIAWQARPGKYDASLESWMIVAWFAVQESWRQTLLVYLYMAVCGVSSDDPRIQKSIRQIFSVIGTVKKREASDVNISFFVQYLMAGICARSEKHRSLARQRLSSVPETAPRLARAVDFVPVLDHLWHGAAAGGRPIKWEDYIWSREVALPVLM